ncbi:MAG TPA: Holliday junction branch migration protein RuvA [Gemmatimonadaceae bacterium]|nr:Holliday junction branch migration protein RuvA [Gemmatimonadaceae bacterium]
MISQIAGTLTAKELDRVELLTSGGVGYELAIPLGVYEKLPTVGEEASLFTHLVVRDDGWLLFGFNTPFERSVFRRLLTANGVGPALALGMLSTLSAERVVRAIVERDIHTLQGIPRVGRKKAERLVLDLAEKMADIGVESAAGGLRSEGTAAEDAIRALVSLGYTTADAEKGVRAALDSGGRGVSAPELIRLALGKVGQR